MKLTALFFIFAVLLFAVSGVSSQPNKEISAAARENAYRANNLGVAQLEQYNHKAGAEEFKRALAIDPQLKIAQINLAIALFNAQDLDGALQAAEIGTPDSAETCVKSLKGKASQSIVTNETDKKAIV